MRRPRLAILCPDRGAAYLSRLLIYYFHVNFFRFLMFFSLATWLGALIFFPIVASIAFSALPSTHLAGVVVGNSLQALHWMGLIAGPLFVICSSLYDRVVDGRFQPFRASHLGVIVMLLLTAFSQFKIIPRMDSLRASAGEIAALSLSNPVRQEFERLHARSVQVEGAILLLAIAALYLTSRRSLTL